MINNSYVLEVNFDWGPLFSGICVAGMYKCTMSSSSEVTEDTTKLFISFI